MERSSAWTWVRTVRALHEGFGEGRLDIGILGQGIGGATSVSFNGMPATFTVKSDRFLMAASRERRRARARARATTGDVTVTTPSGTLTGNVQFQVRP